MCDASRCGAEIDLPEAGRARAAAYLITAAEGAALHLPPSDAAADFDPDVRDRLIAGAMIPAAWVVQAQKFRRWYHEAVLRLFEEVDAIIAPATPCVAPPIGQKTFMLNGQRYRCAQISASTRSQFHSSACLSSPFRCPAGGMPIGVQIIAAPWREDVALRIAYDLEARGIVRAPRPPE